MPCMRVRHHRSAIFSTLGRAAMPSDNHEQGMGAAMEESYVVGASPPLLPPPLMPVEATLPEPASEGRPASTAHRNESKSSAQRSDAAAEVPSTVEAVAGKRAAEVVEETLPAKRRHTDSRGTRITRLQQRVAITAALPYHARMFCLVHHWRHG